MKECEELLKEVEESRKILVDPWGKLLCQSGAVVLKRPGFLSCIFGLLFQAARDVGKDVDKIINIKLESPFIKIDTTIGELSNIESTKDCIVNLAKVMEQLAKNGEEITKKLDDIFKKIAESSEGWTKAFYEKAGGMMEM